VQKYEIALAISSVKISIERLNVFQECLFPTTNSQNRQVEPMMHESTNMLFKPSCCKERIYFVRYENNYTIIIKVIIKLKKRRVKFVPKEKESFGSLKHYKIIFGTLVLNQE